MLIYVSTLEGFSEGIKFYLTPDWSKMGNVEIWKQAATQIFYSLGAGEGSQLILSSYNPWNTNAHRDALLIGLCNSLTSIYAGFVVFGVLGFLSVTKGVGKFEQGFSSFFSQIFAIFDSFFQEWEMLLIRDQAWLLL